MKGMTFTLHLHQIFIIFLGMLRMIVRGVSPLQSVWMKEGYVVVMYY
jgi:hypothetical protein